MGRDKNHPIPYAFHQKLFATSIFYWQCINDVRFARALGSFTYTSIKNIMIDTFIYYSIFRTDGGSGPVKFMTNFPKKVFGDEEYGNSLENLGLVPSAVLMMTK